MSLSVIDNLLNPPILFFILGLAATLLRSDLEIPQPIPRLLSLYLLMAIGLKGGVELSEGMDGTILLTLVAAIGMAMLVPLYAFFVLRRRVSVANAAALSATYGSVSAVTFVTAMDFLGRNGIDYGGAMVAALALMESPAIIVGVMLYRYFQRDNGDRGFSWGELARDALLNGSVLLLLGSLAIGLLIGREGGETLKPFTTEIFTGMLCLFLLDMGLVAARRLGDLRATGVFLIGFALLAPFAHALAGGLVAAAIGLDVGDALLFTVLCASASYIAVPAAIRQAIPAASPSLYLPLALGVTFPLNITLGLPIYYAWVQWLVG